MDRSDIDELVFRAKTNDEKIEDFEPGMVKLVLRQLGWNGAQIATAEREQSGLTWAWFNQSTFIPVRVGSTRVFRYNLLEILSKTPSHPLTAAFRTFHDQEPDDDERVALIFRVGTVRWVMTNLPDIREPHIYVFDRDQELRLLPFARFFANRWSLRDE